MFDVKEDEKTRQTDLFSAIGKMGHEQLVFCNDKATGLKALIGIHNTVLGPALGGTRMWNYSNEQEAIVDVLRLSRGMTFKAAISGLNLGGGKAVIIGDATKDKNEALLRRFGRFIESLNGKYVTAEDVNMTPIDMEYVSMETRHVTGLSESIGGGGDPSPVTAYGVYMGIKAASRKVYGSDSLNNKSIAVQGAGSVGRHLCEYLHKEGAKIFVSDFVKDKALKAASDFKATFIEIDDIYDQEVDIFSPCALGAVINNDTIKRLKCKIIAGGANNQLEDEDKHGTELMERGIHYAPDFLINAGGLINVGIDYLGGWSKQRVYSKAEQIYDTTLAILEKSEKEGIHAQSAAILLAQQRIEEIGNVKLSM